FRRRVGEGLLDIAALPRFEHRLHREEAPLIEAIAARVVALLVEEVGPLVDDLAERQTDAVLPLTMLLELAGWIREPRIDIVGQIPWNNILCCRERRDDEKSGSDPETKLHRRLLASRKPRPMIPRAGNPEKPG